MKYTIESDFTVDDKEDSDNIFREDLIQERKEREDMKKTTNPLQMLLQIAILCIGCYIGFRIIVTGVALASSILFLLTKLAILVLVVLLIIWAIKKVGDK